MKEFLFEMHAHNREISRCARATAEELVEEYVRLGYDGIVSTNHLNPHTFTAKRFSDFSWEQKAEIFIEGFKQIK